MGLQAFVKRVVYLEDEDGPNLQSWKGRICTIHDLDHLDEGGEVRRPLNPLAGYSSPVDTVLPFPVVRGLDATMTDAVRGYVEKKIPREPLKEALAKEMGIRILGCYAQHFEQSPQTFGYEAFEPIPFAPAHKAATASSKRFNIYRPRFYWADRTSVARDFVCAVFPGRDYLLQYASLIRHLSWDLTLGAMRNFQIIRYPHVESALAAWTRLDGQLVHAGDVVIIGYVDELKSYLAKNASFDQLGESENDYYVSIRFAVKSNGRHLNLLGVKYSYWGSIAEVLADEFCRLKVAEIIYFAKLGTLTTSDHIYKKAFFSREYFVVDYNKLRHRISGLRNHLAEFHPGDLSGRHTSVPTVLEEDYYQRQLLTELGIETIDNEIAKIARAVETNNRLGSHQVRYSPVHFATDYIRRRNEKLIETHSDLSKDHTDDARAQKADIIRKISLDVLIPYLESI